MSPESNDLKITRADLAMRAKVAIKLESRELARDYAQFFEQAWGVLFPDVPFSPSWHYEYLCEVLQYAASGQMKIDHPERRGLIINVPPRTLKSFMANITLPDWVWASSPEKKFMCISYGVELAVNELATKRRKLLGESWYTARWPKVKIQEDINLKHRWDSTAGGYMIATTPGGHASGAGANIIIIDDIIKLDDAYSAARTAANEWYENELFSRLNNQAEDFFIVICQRLHEEDLPGYLNKNEPGQWWNVVIPLECEEDTEYVFPISGKKYLRKKGDVLLPDRFPPHVVAALKKSSTRWAGQYQQKPMPATGNLINPNWWVYYDSDENGASINNSLPSCDIVIVSVDCSFKGTQTSDFVCLTKWGFVGARGYLLELVCERMDYVRTKSAIRSAVTTGLRPSVTLIEDAANGSAVINELRREMLPTTIVPVKPEGGKLSRAHAAAPEVEAGNCFLPKQAPWLQAFVSQLALGPEAAANDDQIDSWSQVINYRREHRWGFFESLEQKNQTSEKKAEAQSVTHSPPKQELVSAARKATRDEFRRRMRIGRRR
jgi:predicted phage terminase large subunit-like protein